MAGKGGGAWKVAYADFVTAMMAFFLVMWITSQGQEVKEAVAEHFREPLYSLDGHPADGKHKSRKKVRTRNAAWIPGGESEDISHMTRVVVRREPTGTGTVVFFADESVELDERAKDTLESFVPELLGKPQLIEIRGHSSRRPLPENSPFHNAWEVCYARCVATMDYLAERGIPRERMRLSQTAGHEPFAQTTDAHWLLRNPRVEVIVLGEMLEAGGNAQLEPKPPSADDPAAASSHDAHSSVGHDTSHH